MKKNKNKKNLRLSIKGSRKQQFVGGPELLIALFHDNKLVNRK